MYEKISEPIDVLVAFRKNRAEPMTFKWGNRYYQVKKVNLVHIERHGRDKIHIFSVTDGLNAFRISFSSESLLWNLEEAVMM